MQLRLDDSHKDGKVPMKINEFPLELGGPH